MFLPFVVMAMLTVGWSGRQAAGSDQDPGEREAEQGYEGVGDSEGRGGDHGRVREALPVAVPLDRRQAIGGGDHGHAYLEAEQVARGDRGPDPAEGDEFARGPAPAPGLGLAGRRP